MDWKVHLRTEARIVPSRPQVGPDDLVLPVISPSSVPRIWYQNFGDPKVDVEPSAPILPGIYGTLETPCLFCAVTYRRWVGVAADRGDGMDKFERWTMRKAKRGEERLKGSLGDARGATPAIAAAA